jgi:hypothetical protein
MCIKLKYSFITHIILFKRLPDWLYDALIHAMQVDYLLKKINGVLMHFYNNM